MSENNSNQPGAAPSPQAETTITVDGRRYKRRDSAATLICFLLLWALCYVCILFCRGTRTSLPVLPEQLDSLIGQVASENIIAEVDFCYTAPRPAIPTPNGHAVVIEAITPKVLTKDRPGGLLRSVPADTPIMRKGEIITAETVARLQAYQYIFPQLTAKMRRLLPLHQSALLCGLVLFCFGCGLFAIKQQLFSQVDRIILLTIFLALHIILTLVSQKLFAEYINGTSLQLCSLLPLCLVPALTSNLLGKRIGFCTVLLLSALTPLLIGGEDLFQFYLYSLFGGIAGSALFHDIHNRLGFLLGGLGVTATVVGLNLFFAWSLPLPWAWSSFSPFWTSVLHLACGNALVVILALLLVPLLVERFFDIITAYKLNELNDRDHPLLLRLREEAPGTYEHSIDVARLASEAARAIGANAALAEVCAYFHDIGKLYSPKMFAENLTENEANPHDAMSPQESCQVLREHVRFGIELARKYRLQRPICEAIAQHHGDSIIPFFYQKALNQAKKENLPPPALCDFSYDGTKPQRPEVVIVEIADTCEAAVRALVRSREHSTAANITQKVNELVLAKMQMHQLDNACLTMAELFRIRDQIIKTLCNIHHLRPEYPKQLKPIRKADIGAGTTTDSPLAVLANADPTTKSQPGAPADVDPTTKSQPGTPADVDQTTESQPGTPADANGATPSTP